ncbi:MAG: SDR family NAD(P)-dependent oxidoreductase [Myxococcota bacterium]
MRVAVTGSSGFLGSRLAVRLKELDIEIIELDIRSGVDLTDWRRLMGVEKSDVVIHLAARTFVPASYENPREFYSANIISTLNALELARKFRAKFIFASSYVYGVPEYLPIDENHPTKPFNPYAQSKIICEQLCAGYHRDFGMNIVIFRPFNLYGPGQDERFLIPTIIKQARSGSVMLKDPKPKRDWIFVDDAKEAFVKALYYDKSEFEVFNLGSGKSSSVEEIVAVLRKYVQGDFKVAFTGEERKFEVMDTVADISKARRLLGWNPGIELEEGIKKCLEEI